MLFVTVDNIATTAGVIESELNADHLNRLPSISVYAEKQLAISGSGVLMSGVSEIDRRSCHHSPGRRRDPDRRATPLAVVPTQRGRSAHPAAVS
jgi:hypothetical protein